MKIKNPREARHLVLGWPHEGISCAELASSVRTAAGEIYFLNNKNMRKIQFLLLFSVFWSSIIAQDKSIYQELIGINQRAIDSVKVEKTYKQVKSLNDVQTGNSFILELYEINWLCLKYYEDSGYRAFVVLNYAYLGIRKDVAKGTIKEQGFEGILVYSKRHNNYLFYAVPPYFYLGFTRTGYALLDPLKSLKNFSIISRVDSSLLPTHIIILSESQTSLIEKECFFFPQGSRFTFVEEQPRCAISINEIGLEYIFKERAVINDVDGRESFNKMIE